MEYLQITRSRQGDTGPQTPVDHVDAIVFRPRDIVADALTHYHVHPGKASKRAARRALSLRRRDGRRISLTHSPKARPSGVQ